MNFVDGIILGVIQGFSEFLPISSSGHLVVFQNILSPGPHNVAFDLAVHMGTVLSILTVYFKMVLKILENFGRGLVNKQNRKFGFYLTIYILLASVPTALIGFGLKKQLESLFSSLFAVAIGFAITGVLLFLTRNKRADGKMISHQDLESEPSLNWKKALLIGLAQGCAIAPGVSRSGSTIGMALLLGVERQTAALFSFLMSVPVILGAGLLELRELSVFKPEMLAVAGVGFVAAYLSGLAGLLLILKIVKKGRLEVFSYYLWALSAFILVNHWF